MNLRELLGLTTGIDPYNQPPLVKDPNRDSTGALINPQQTTQPIIKDIQLDNNGQIMNDADRANYQAQLQVEKIMNAPLSLKEKLFGAERPQTYTLAQLNDSNGNTQVQPYFDKEDYKKVHNGWFNDFADGYKENYNNGFKVSNWNDSEQAKNIAQRLGEGFGSTMRFIDSPAGRALITGGVGLAMGANPAEAFGYGLGAGNIHNKLQIDNQAYRNLLAQQGLDTSKLGNGWVDKDLAQTYALNNYRQGMLQARRDIAQASDNTKRAGLIQRMHASGEISDGEAQRLIAQYGLTVNDFKASNQTRNADINAYLAPHKANALDTGAWVGVQGIDVRNNALAQQAQQNQYRNAKLSDTQLEKIVNSTKSLNEMDNIIDKYSNKSKDAVFGLQGAIRRNPVTSGYDAGVAELRQDVDLFRKTIAKDKEGARLTDQDQKYYDKALLNPNLTREKFIQLAIQYKATLLLNRRTMLNEYSNLGKNTSPFVLNNNILVEYKGKRKYIDASMVNQAVVHGAKLIK